MINNQKLYNYHLLESNEYGANDISEVKGVIRMSISLLNQQISDNSIYKDAQFMGLTMDREINEHYIIEYDNMLLKVLYINKQGRYRQVYLNSTNG